jgi:hypothetical protein
MSHNCHFDNDLGPLANIVPLVLGYYGAEAVALTASMIRKASRVNKQLYQSRLDHLCLLLRKNGLSFHEITVSGGTTSCLYVSRRSLKEVFPSQGVPEPIRIQMLRQNGVRTEPLVPLVTSTKDLPTHDYLFDVFIGLARGRS